MDMSPNLIFYLKALCILSALFETHNQSWFGKGKIIIYTNNHNRVDIFNSFQALPAYNPLLKAAVSILVSGQHHLQVLHVPGTNNFVADALSRLHLTAVLSTIPNLKITPFQPVIPSCDSLMLPISQPPRQTLGEPSL